MAATSTFPPDMLQFSRHCIRFLSWSHPADHDGGSILENPLGANPGEEGLFLPVCARCWLGAVEPWLLEELQSAVEGLPKPTGLCLLEAAAAGLRSSRGQAPGAWSSVPHGKAFSGNTPGLQASRRSGIGSCFAVCSI